jgi:hypothetical protein
MTDDDKRPRLIVIEGGAPDEPGITEERAILMCMRTEGSDAQAEIVRIVQAWRQGRLLPPAEAPVLSDLLDDYVDDDGNPDGA